MVVPLVWIVSRRNPGKKFIERFGRERPARPFLQQSRLRSFQEKSAFPALFPLQPCD
jgi:hypothetical protein